jgi:hypothetical protein
MDTGAGYDPLVARFDTLFCQTFGQFLIADAPGWQITAGSQSRGNKIRLSHYAFEDSAA